MSEFTVKDQYDFADLRQLVEALRAPDGCPWDSVQTHESIRRNFIEEVYEACEAIDRDDPEALREELGDVLLHVVFHASIEAQAGRFTLDDVCDTVVKKMVSRHPSLFGGEGASLSWDELKRREKGQKTLSEELEAVARSLPATWRAEKLQKRSQAAGAVLSPPAEDGSPEGAIGRRLFETVSLAREAGVDPEAALHRYCDRLIDAVRSS